MDLAVNVSDVQIRHPTFMDDTRQALADSGLPASSLVLEVSERSVVDSPSVVQALEGLKATGIRLAVDNFGAGYSPLSAIGRYPVDIVKIDLSVVGALDANGSEASVASTIVELAGKLNLKTVAEGIETPAQLARLRAMGCQFGQGYYVAHPLPVDQMDALIREQAAIRRGRSLVACPQVPSR